MKISSLKSFCILVLLFTPALTYAANQSYYVTQAGSGSRDGSSAANAWSVSNFNSSGNWSTNEISTKIDPGDTVYFSGKITTSIRPAGSGMPGKYITLDGYKAGNATPLNGEDTAAALITTVNDITSAPDNVSYAAIYAEGTDYLNIQDFRAKSCVAGIIVSGSNYVYVKRNYIETIRNEAIAVTKLASEICKFVTIGGSAADGNFVRNAGWTTNYNSRDPKMINLYKHQDVIFSYNKVYGSGLSGDYTSNIMEVHESDRTLIEYNDLADPKIESVISLKEYGPKNVIVRFNKIHGAPNGGVNCGGDSRGGGSVDGAYIYGNEIYGNMFGIQVRLGAKNIYIWNNIIRDNTRWGAGVFGFGGQPDNVRIYNNVFSKNTFDYTESPGLNRTGLYVGDVGSNGVIAMNNLFSDNRINPDNNYYHQVYIASNIASRVNLEHNTYYSSKNKTGHIYWSNGVKTLAQVQALGQEDDTPRGKEANPGFVNYSNGDYQLDGTNTEDGEDLSECFDIPIQGKNYHICYSDALDSSSTNWKTTPPTVATAKQEDYGSWERGAYVYKDGSGSSISASAPAPPSPIWIVE